MISLLFLDFMVSQIDAHVGGVNDIAFSHPNKQLCIITCGDDKTIKVILANVFKLNIENKREFPEMVHDVNGRCGTLCLDAGSIHLKVMKLLYILSVLTTKKLSRFLPIFIVIFSKSCIL